MKKKCYLFLSIIATTVNGMKIDVNESNSGLPIGFVEQLPEGMRDCIDKVSDGKFLEAAEKLVSVVRMWPPIRQSHTFVGGNLNISSIANKLKEYVKWHSSLDLAEEFFFDYRGTEDYNKFKKGEMQGNFFENIDDWLENQFLPSAPKDNATKEHSKAVQSSRLTIKKSSKIS